MEHKNLKLLVVFLFLFSFVSFVCADRVVEFSFFEAIKYENGTQVSTTNKVLGAGLDVYPCLNSACNIVGNKISSLSSVTNTEKLSVNFPTTMSSVYGYLLYFYHQDFFGIEINATINGTSGTTTNANIYLYKREGGYAPIKSFDFVSTNTRLSNVTFDVKIEMDDSTYVLVPDRRRTNITLKEDVNVSLKFNVLYNGTNIHQESRFINIPYGESVTNERFFYLFSSVGDYEVEVETEIVDNQLFSTTKKNEKKSIKIISDSLNNYSYSNLNIYPTNGTIYLKENYSLVVAHESFYVDEYGNVNNRNSNLNFNIRDFNNTSIYNYNIKTSSGNYTFNYLFLSTGNYTINVSACTDGFIGSFSTCGSKLINVEIIEKEEPSIKKTNKKDNTPKENPLIIFKESSFEENTKENTVEDSRDSNQIIYDYNSNNVSNDTFKEEIVVFVIGSGILIVLIKIIFLLAL